MTRLLWRSQARELPRAAWHALRRLVRRESRWYLEIDGRVIGRLVREEDHWALLKWLEDTHRETFRCGQEFYREVASEVHVVNPGDAGTP